MDVARVGEHAQAIGSL